jgi:hypothetical protein
VFADFVNNHKIAIKCDDEDIKTSLIEELEVIRSKEIITEGKLQVESKDIIKELIGRSPDIADALVMRMYFELEKPTKEILIQDPVALLLARHRTGKINNTNNTYL